MAINFSGQAAGTTWTFGGTNGATLVIKKASGTKAYTSKSANGGFYIASYGAVGGHVTGTFSGTFWDPLSSAEVMAEGKFDFVRTADK
jgi:hypothetical protein